MNSTATLLPLRQEAPRLSLASIALFAAAALAAAGCGGSTSSDTAGKPTLSASPNPVPANSTTTTLHWDVGNDSTGQVYVTENDGPEKLVGENRTATKDVNWITKEKYEFRLYAGRDRKTKLTTIVVTREPDKGARR